MTATQLPIRDAISGSSAHILVVDDHELNTEFLKGILEPDYCVSTANTGEMALALCRDTAPDLIILDIFMEGESGLDICRKIKADATLTDIPIMFATSSREPQHEDECWDAGCVDFLQKPINARTLINRVKAHLTLKFQADTLRSMAYIDGLTGVFNRCYFDELLERQLAHARRTGDVFCVLLLDLDHFKQFNDHYGHLDGDDCLRKVAAYLKQTMARPMDAVSRYGGEEFAALLPSTALTGASTLAQRLVAGIAGMKIPHQTSPHTVVTSSIGVSEISQPSVSPREALDEADRALYRAKEAGRNQMAH